MSQKVPTFKLSVTLSNLNRFVKFSKYCDLHGNVAAIMLSCHVLLHNLRLRNLISSHAVLCLMLFLYLVYVSCIVLSMSVYSRTSGAYVTVYKLTFTGIHINLQVLTSNLNSSKSIGCEHLNSLQRKQ